MSDPTIRTNWKVYPVIGWENLTQAERAEFDYLANDDLRQATAEFVRYKRVVYHLDDFMPVPDKARRPANQNWLNGWTGYQSDSAFSGVLMKYHMTNSGERGVVMATYSS